MYKQTIIACGHLFWYWRYGPTCRVVSEYVYIYPAHMSEWRHCLGGHCVVPTHLESGATSGHLTYHLARTGRHQLSPSSSWGLCLLGCWRRTKAPPEPVKYLHKQLTFPFTGVQLLCKAGMLTVVDCGPVCTYIHTSKHHYSSIIQTQSQRIPSNKTWSVVRWNWNQ